MAAALVQSKFAQGVDPAVTFNSSVTSGNMVEVTCNQGDDSSAITFAVTDNKGNTYNTDTTNLRSTGANGTCIQKFYAYNVTGGASFQVSVNNSGTNPVAVSIVEYSGLTTTNPLDKFAEGTGLSTTPTTGSSGTLTQADELVTYAVGSRLTAIVSSPGTFTLIGTQTTTGDWGAQSALYKIVAATTAVSGDGTLSASQTWVTVLATYLAAAAASPKWCPDLVVAPATLAMRVEMLAV